MKQWENDKASNRKTVQRLRTGNSQRTQTGAQPLQKLEKCKLKQQRNIISYPTSLAQVRLPVLGTGEGISLSTDESRNWYLASGELFGNI